MPINSASSATTQTTVGNPVCQDEQSALTSQLPNDGKNAKSHPSMVLFVDAWAQYEFPRTA